MRARLEARGQLGNRARGGDAGADRLGAGDDSRSPVDGRRRWPDLSGGWERQKWPSLSREGMTVAWINK